MNQLPLYIHSHHKCATRWQIAYFEQVAARNGLRFALEDSPWSVRRKPADIVFFGNSHYDGAIHDELFGLHVVRNPLSIIESAYWSHLTSHPADEGSPLGRQRAVLQASDADAGRYLTLTFLFNGAMTPLGTLHSWKFADERFPTLRMEDLVLAPAATFRALMARGTMPELLLPPDEDFRFERFSGGRHVGQVADESHYRSGSPDSWRALPEPLVRFMLAHFRDLMALYPEVGDRFVAKPVRA